MDDQQDGNVHQNVVEIGAADADATASRPSPATRWIAAVGVLVFAAVVVGLLVVVNRNNDAPTAATGAPPISLVDTRPANALANVRFELDGTLSDQRSTGTVYRFAAPTVDSNRVSSLAAIFGAQGEPQRTPDGWEVVGAQGRFALTTPSGSAPSLVRVTFSRQYKNAASTVTTRASAQGDVLPPPAPPPPSTPTNLLSSSDAEAKARDLLARAGVVGGIGDWTFEVTDGGVTAGAACMANAPCAPPTTVIRSRVVTAHRRINAVNITGLDWRVSFGDNGAIDDASGPLADLTSVGDYGVRSAREVFADMQAGTAWMNPGQFGVIGRAVDEVNATSASTVVSGSVAGSVPVSIAGAHRGLATRAGGGSGGGGTVGSPTTVTITSAEAGLIAVPGMIDGALVGFVVPSYRFAIRSDATYPLRSVEAVALDQGAFTPASSTPTSRFAPVGSAVTSLR